MFFFSLPFVFNSHAVKPVTCVSELSELYRESCKRHNAIPIEVIMKHLDTLDLNTNSRRPILNLREQNLTAESCEALEEVLKRVSSFCIPIIHSTIYSNDSGYAHSANHKYENELAICCA